MSANKKKAVWIFAAGIAIGLLSLFTPAGRGNPDEGQHIIRNEFGEGEKDISLIATTQEGEIEVCYQVAERMYTEEEIADMIPKFLCCLEQEVLGENPSLNQVSSNLMFADSIDGYPFSISWQSSQPEIIGIEGDIKKEIIQDTEVILTAECEYETYEFEHRFPIVVVPGEANGSTTTQKILEALAIADENSLTEEYLALPSEINGHSVKWKERQEKKGIKMAAFCMGLSILFFFSDSIEGKKQERRRLEEIAEDYPEFTLKYSMLIGSGMTPRQAFERIGHSYTSVRGKKRLLYEEVLIGLRELESGVPERQVYENFGRRCGIRATEKFGNLMARNLRKGTEGLKCALRQEAAEAMEMHKEQVRKQGETAGTKLLFPMLVLLLIVMVIIMIPAFSSFNI